MTTERSNVEVGESLREHRMEINVIEKTLRDLYYNPETGYQNAEKLFKDIQKYNLGITGKGVQSWLQAQPAYTQHKQVIKNHPKRQSWVRDLGEQLQMDLIFMSIENNKSNRHLAMIEQFNRTLKGRIWKSFTANHNRKWKDDLPKFIDGYNKSIHRTIGIPPANVNKKKC